MHSQPALRKLVAVQPAGPSPAARSTPAQLPALSPPQVRAAAGRGRTGPCAAPNTSPVRSPPGSHAKPTAGSREACRAGAPPYGPITTRDSLIVSTPAPPFASRGTARSRRPRARPRMKMATAMYLEHYLDSKRPARPPGRPPARGLHAAPAPPPRAARGRPGLVRAAGRPDSDRGGGPRAGRGGAEAEDGVRGARRGLQPSLPRQFQVRHDGAGPAGVRRGRHHEAPPPRDAPPRSGPAPTRASPLSRGWPQPHAGGVES